MGPLILACVVAATVPSTSPSLPSVDQFADRHQSAPQDAAVVVGIEKYFVVDHVPYAARDAQAFWSFLVFDRGVLPERISLLKDARGANDRIEQEVEKRAAQVGPGGTLWFYFAGHGAPDPSGKDGLLVGVDAQQTVESVRDRSVSRRWLLDALGKSHAQHVLVFLDACFSGNGRDGHPLAQDLRPLLPTAALGTLAQGAVLTGARSDEVSGPLDAAKHGLFTYFLLGALRGWGEQDPSGPVTVEGAFSYLRKAMGAALANGDRQQEPDLSAPADAKTILLAQGLGEQGPDLSVLAAGEYDTATTDTPATQEHGPAASADDDPDVSDKRDRAYSEALRGRYATTDLRPQEPALPPTPMMVRPPGTSSFAPAAAPMVRRFVVAGDGTVLDTQTGLVWQQGFASGVTLDEAKSYCAELSLPGTGWRLPSAKEFKTLRGGRVSDEREIFWISGHVPVFPEPGFLRGFFQKQQHHDVKCVRSPW